MSVHYTGLKYFERNEWTIRDSRTRDLGILVQHRVVGGIVKY